MSLASADLPRLASLAPPLRKLSARSDLAEASRYIIKRRVAPTRLAANAPFEVCRPRHSLQPSWNSTRAELVSGLVGRPSRRDRLPVPTNFGCGNKKHDPQEFEAAHPQAFHKVPYNKKEGER
jgi:hypothetical protein